MKSKNPLSSVSFCFASFQGDPRWSAGGFSAFASHVWACVRNRTALIRMFLDLETQKGQGTEHPRLGGPAPYPEAELLPATKMVAESLKKIFFPAYSWTFHF
ncbi:hypothetical protein VTO42DRAFT_2707 [Malbranchea cinnamomea]